MSGCVDSHVKGTGSASTARAVLFIKVLVFAVLCVGGVTAVLFFKRSASASVAILIAFILIALSLASVYHNFIQGRKTCLGQLGCRSLFYLFGTCIVLAVAMEIGTLVGAATKSPFVLGDWSVQRLGMFACIAYLIEMLSLEYLPVDFFARFKERCKRIEKKSDRKSVV